MREDWQQLIDQTVQDESLRDRYAWEPFAKGSSNSIFLGRLKRSSRDLNTRQNQLVESTVVLRINAPAKDTLGAERRREAAILDRIKPYSWALQIIRNEPEQGWCLMHHYDPIKNQQDTSKHLSHEYHAQLLAAIDELQAISVSSDDLQIDYQDLLNETYLPMALERRDALAQSSIQSIKDDLATLPKLPCCLVHHDIHLGNLVLCKPHEDTESRAHLIILDWEYAALGNPWFDASCLSRYLSIPADHIHELALFKQLDKATFNSALKQANRMTETLQTLWYWARE